ncbi:MAG: AzlD domain-containing protein [Acidimicrobiaceae bacterium]|nr:AzlD domain-containing protein [Acidimicrobiaceae bacterium]
MSWPLLILLAAGSYGLKALGVTTLGSVVERRFGSVVALLPAALFSALIVVMTFEDAGQLVLDFRVAGVAVGALATWRKAPLLVVVASAMAVTAILRALV